MPALKAKMLDQQWINLYATSVDGLLIASTPQVASDEQWTVDALSLSANPYIPCICTLYHGDPETGNFIEQSNDGGQDNFEGTIPIPGGEFLTFVWSGEVGTSRLKARLHYVRYQLVTEPAQGDPTLLNLRQL